MSKDFLSLEGCLRRMLEKEQAHGKGGKDCNPTPMIQIYIEPMEGQRFTLDVKASETILDVKAMIQARVDAMFQNSNVVELIFLDMPMFTGPYVGHGNEPRTLEHYDIEEGTVIKVRWTAIQTHPHSEKELVQKKGEDKQKTDMYARLERLESQVEEIHNMLNKDKFYCATCEVSLNGAQRYANHMAGKFHENHVKCKIEELQSIGIEDKIDTIHHDQLRIERKLDQVCSTFEQVCFRLDELP